MDVTQTHEEVETLTVDVELPGHAPRTETPTYSRTHKQRVAVDDRCWVCRRTAAESGHPLETHHHPIERSLAEMIDFELVQADCQAGEYGDAARQFDWEDFWNGSTTQTYTVTWEDSTVEQVTIRVPADPYKFVDNMLVNGRVLCKEHHTGKDAGMHAMPFPLVLGEKYGRKGYRFTATQILHHGDEEKAA